MSEFHPYTAPINLSKYPSGSPEVDFGNYHVCSRLFPYALTLALDLGPNTFCSKAKSVWVRPGKMGVTVSAWMPVEGEAKQLGECESTTVLPPGLYEHLVELSLMPSPAWPAWRVDDPPVNENYG